MRLATVNLLGGRSVAHGRVEEDELRSAASSLDADVVVLQEVDRGQPRSHDVDQTAVVADALARGSWRFLPTLHGTPGEAWTAAAGDGSGEQPPGPAYGIGLVSRHPVTSWAVRRFKPAPVGLPLLVPGQGLMHVDDEPRAALAAGSRRRTARSPSWAPTCRSCRGVERRAAARGPVGPHPAGPRVLLGDLNLPGRVVGLSGTRWSPAPAWRRTRRGTRACSSTTCCSTGTGLTVTATHRLGWGRSVTTVRSGRPRHTGRRD